MTPDPRTPTGGVREAPRQEIAGGEAPAVQRPLWGFIRDGHRWEGGLGQDEWSAPTAGMAIGDGWAGGKGVELLLGGCDEREMRSKRASGVVARR